MGAWLSSATRTRPPRPVRPVRPPGVLGDPRPHESPAFGTLMSVESAVALQVGIVVLGQAPQPIQALGVLLVAAAGGAAQTGRRLRRRPIIASNTGS